MEDKKSAKILIGLLKKYPFNDEEKVAIESAIGIMAWTSLAGNRAKQIKDKRNKNSEW